MPQNLKKSKTGIYTYRKVLPPDVRHVFDNKSEIKRSLGDNREQAMLAYHRIEAEIGQKIESARQEARKANHFEAHEQKPRSERALVPIKGDTHNLGPSIAKWQIESLMDQLRARRAGEFDEDEFEDVEQQLIEWPPLIKKAIATGKVMHWSPQISNWLMIKGYFLDATVEQVQTLTYDYLRFLKKCYEVLAKWQQGEDAEIEWPLPPGPFLRAAWEPKEVFVAPLTSQPRASKLSDVIPLYEKHLNIVQRKTRTTRLSWWRRLVDFCDDKPINEVTRGDIFSFFESRLKAPDGDNWTMDTNSKVKREFIVVFSLADAHDLTNDNPANALRAMPKISAEDEKKRLKPRYPFTDEKLNTIFASEWYDPDSEKMRGRMKWDLAARYWIPLICLHHGLRVREATQICVHDIIFGAYPLLAIQTDEDIEEPSTQGTQLPVRSLKNEATKRTVPIHPKLVELGFMELVQEVAMRGPNAPLFLSSLPDAKEVPEAPKGEAAVENEVEAMWGRAFEQSFVRYVRDKLGFGSGYGTHSFRHTLEDCLRNIQLTPGGIWPAGLGQYYSGRKVPGDHDRGFFRSIGSERHYGEGFNAELVMPFVEKVQYDKVKLPRPYAQWLNGRTSVDSRLITILDRDYGTAWRKHP